MSRPIKFRAWHPKHGMFSAEQMSEDQLTLDVNGRGLVNVHSGNVRLSEFYTHMIPMQYTGLKDKNGVGIYEGDVVEFKFGNEKCRGVVKYDDSVARFVKEFSDSYGKQEKDLSSYSASHVVVGNIYENPELLESSDA